MAAQVIKTFVSHLSLSANFNLYKMGHWELAQFNQATGPWVKALCSYFIRITMHVGSLDLTKTQIKQVFLQLQKAAKYTMPRYSRKTIRGSYQAVVEIRNEQKLRLREASDLFRIPKSSSTNSGLINSNLNKYTTWTKQA